MAMPLELPTYTTDDLRRFPRDGQRYELLEGMLLVTPAPGNIHQIVISRLFASLVGYLPDGSPARVVSPGEIEIKPKTLMDPDLLVYPASYPIGTRWTRIHGWWLAVEVYSRSSRVYDHDFKRQAYLTLGVREVWMVDTREEVILVSHTSRVEQAHRESLVFHPPEITEPLTLDLTRLFAGLP